MRFKNYFFSAFIAIISGCTTKYPVTVGTLGGAVAGAGIGAIVGRASSSVTVPNAMGVGAAIGVPAGILLAYSSDAFAKYYILSSNNSAIDGNYDQIYENQNAIEDMRRQVIMEGPKGLPDEDSAQYIYLGPSLGNVWR